MSITTDRKAAAATQETGTAEKKPKRRIVMIGAILFLLLVLFYIGTAENTVDVTRTTTPNMAPLVSVETVPVAPQTVSISAYAEVRPRWSAELRSAVSGRITTVTDKALAGEHVEAGKPLISIESSQYEAEMAAADYALAQARLALRKAENNTAIARNEFKRDGSKPPSDLAIHLPELRIAQSAVSSAEAKAAAAKRQLQDATVIAPFSGFITERFVSLGQTVNAGDRLLKIVDNESFELIVELGKQKWNLLKQPLNGTQAKLYNESGELLAHATVRRGGGFLDETTRQYKVFLEISEPDPSRVLSGDFVQVTLPGATVEKALSIPETSLTQEGYVWYVDKEDRLARFSPKVLSRQENRIIIEAPEAYDEWRISVAPLVSFLPGQRVRTSEAEG